MHWVVHLLHELEQFRIAAAYAYNSKYLDEHYPGWTHIILTHVWVIELARLGCTRFARADYRHALA